MEDREKVKEAYMEYQMIDQHAKQMHQQLEAVTQQIMDLSGTSLSLDEFEKIKEGNDILVPLSSGIFAKASVKNTSNLLINVGANVVVTKDIAGTKELISRQLAEIKGLQKRMVDELEKLAYRAAQLEKQFQPASAEIN